jgi:Flp pilus assembly protein protease CpaA
MINPTQITELGLTIAILFVLFYASIEDMRYHRITKRNVFLVLLLVLVFTMFYHTYGIERTATFLIAFGVFGGITILTKGGFGFGDTIILSSIALYIGRVQDFGTYAQILGITTLLWGAYHIIRQRQQNKEKKFTFKFSMIDTIPIDRVIPGMILANDYFMEGLKPGDITDLKRKGFLTLKIKYAYPYIPVIFFSFLFYLIFYQHIF